MSKEFDIVVIGAGHNGLIAACYLAKAGLNVCIVEQGKKVGGGTVTAEVTAPGFKSELASMAHQFLQFSPMLQQDELKLKSKYGLEYIINMDEQVACLFDDGRSFVVYKDIDRTCAEIEKFSPKDAVTYRKFYEQSSAAFDMLATGSTSPAPNFGDFISFLDDSEHGQETIKMMFNSSLDIIKPMFESEEVRTYLARYTSEAMCLPYDNGTGSYLNLMIPSTHNYGMAIPKGGSGVLPQKLEQCLLDLGGTVRTSANVTRIILSGGKARGVVLDSGEEIVAKRGVISAINVKQVFGKMLKPSDGVDEGVCKKIQALKPNAFGAFKVHFALKEPIKWKAGVNNPAVNKCMLIEYDSPSWDNMMHNFMDMYLGNPVSNMFAFATPSLIDPSRCPEGNAVGEIYHFQPTELKGGNDRWNQIKDEVTQAMMECVADKALNFDSNNIIATYSMCPIDIEKYNPSMIGGDIQFFGTGVTQFFGNRPLPRWNNYKTPVDDLFLVGTSTYPGGGVAGAARTAMPMICSYLGIDFDAVIR
ncbi:MAG: NAD(P)/FAD-dependent oxidoreductase [Peptococcaceae bacterium]|nr:NAD(P)/FAD-dependent oxidoreductase [Peptococcaceae bacterium]